MQRVRRLANPTKHLLRIQSLWDDDISVIRNSWWYNELPLGSKRFLSYRLALIKLIVKQSLEPGECCVYKIGDDAIAWTIPFEDYTWLGGVAVRPQLLNTVTGKTSGLGARLIKFIENKTINEGKSQVRLTVGHSGLNKFYSRNGYEYMGVVKGVGKVLCKSLGKGSKKGTDGKG